MPNLPFKGQKRWVSSALIVSCVSILLYFLCKSFKSIWAFIAQVFNILQPILIGILLAYLLSPICERMEQSMTEPLTQFFHGNKEKGEKWAAGLAVTFSVLFIILVVAALIGMIIPQLIDSIIDVVNNGFGSEATLKTYLAKILPNSPEQQSNVMTIYQNIVSWLENYMEDTLLPNMTNMVSTISQHIYAMGMLIFNFFIGIIVSAYCLARRTEFKLQLRKLLFALSPNEKSSEYILSKVTLVNSTFLQFFIGKLIDSLIIGILCFIGNLILKIPHALLIAVIIGVTNIIPFFGPFIGAIPSAILILLSDPLRALYFIIFIFLLQQLDGNIIGPKILGSSTGLSSFWVLFSILLFGGLWGVVGMIIAVPLFAVIYNLVKELVDDQLRKKGLPVKAYAYMSREPDMTVVETEDGEDQVQENVRPETAPEAEKTGPESKETASDEASEPRPKRARTIVNPKTNRPRRSGRPRGLDTGRDRDDTKDETQDHSDL